MALDVVKRCGARGCDRPVWAKGLCDTHLSRLRRHGHLEATRATDWGERSAHPLYAYWLQVRRNGVPLTEDWHADFWTFVRDVGERPSAEHTLYRPDKSVPMGAKNAIWSVSKAGPPRDDAHTGKRLSQTEYMRDWYRQRRIDDPFHEFRAGLKAAHGISLEDYERLSESQNGVCAICGRTEHRVSTSNGTPFRLAVDHKHSTAEIRGLLCSMCNHAIGYLDDSPELLARAIDYLRDPPAAKLNIEHNGKHKTRRRERSPSPYVKPEAA